MKHPHKELIESWLKDMTIKLEGDYSCGARPFIDVSIEDVLDDISGLQSFRIKPREFKDGEWYPCIDGCGDEIVYYYNGSIFVAEPDDLCGLTPEKLQWIGKSLGKIKFGE